MQKKSLRTYFITKGVLLTSNLLDSSEAPQREFPVVPKSKEPRRRAFGSKHRLREGVMRLNGGRCEGVRLSYCCCGALLNDVNTNRNESRKKKKITKLETRNRFHASKYAKKERHFHSQAPFHVLRDRCIRSLPHPLGLRP